MKQTELAVMGAGGIRVADSRERLVVQVAQRALRDGPMEQSVLLDQTKQAGARGVDESSLWEILTRHGIAELDGRTYVPRGWSNASTDAASTIGSPRVHRVQVPPQPLRAHVGVTPGPERELQQLRAALQLTSLACEESGRAPHPDWHAIGTQMLGALADELQAATRQLSTQDVPVLDGRVIGETTTHQVLRFDAQGELPTREGSEVILLVGEGQNVTGYPAEILSVFGSEVTVAVPPGCPVPASARLRCDLTWLIAQHRVRLQEVMASTTGFDQTAAVAMTRPSTSPGRVPDVGVLDIRGLNSAQCEAVALSRRDALTWLWGPPGTGKTTTIAAIVHDLAFVQGKRVLLVAPTNVAVDVALAAVLRRCSERAPGAIVRLGAPVDQTLRRQADGEVLVDEVAAKRGSDVAARRVTVAEEELRVRGQLKVLQRESKSARLNAQQETRRRDLERKLANLGHLRRGLDELMREVRRQVCREAHVVAATAHQVLLPTLEGLPFDVVVIDEASMLPVTLAALVAGSGRGHTIVAGDFRQLPPVVQAETEAAHRWLGRSAFEAAGVTDDVARGRQVPGLVALNEQHRMHREIADVVSHAFYPESPLVTASSVLARQVTPNRAWDTSPLLLIDTSDLRTWTARRQGIQSRYNLIHVQLCAALAVNPGLRHAQLGFITPFAPQARLLAGLVRSETQAPDTGVVASTVHRYQGSERDVVVFDTVDSRRGPGRLHPWFVDGEVGSEGARLLNVAASRARHQLVVLADLRFVQQRPSGRDPVAVFLRQVAHQARHVAWQDLIAPGSSTSCVVDLAGALSAALVREPGPADLFLTSVTEGICDTLLRKVPRDRLSETTVWVPAEGVSHDLLDSLEYAGAMIRPLQPIRESVLIVGDTVLSATRDLGTSRSGVGFETRDRGLADAVRRVVRRAQRGGVAGSGSAAERCGTCNQRLVREERSGQWGGVRAVCHRCEPHDVRIRTHERGSPEGSRRRLG